MRFLSHSATLSFAGVLQSVFASDGITGSDSSSLSNGMPPGTVYRPSVMSIEQESHPTAGTIQMPSGDSYGQFLQLGGALDFEAVCIERSKRDRDGRY